MNEVATKQDLANLSKDISKLILENNVLLVNMMDKMMDEKISKNNDVLIPLIDKKIKDNIKDNNEYIFEHFNDQTNRILDLFKGVVMVRKDGSFGVYV
jgi:hypothetical protein